MRRALRSAPAGVEVAVTGMGQDAATAAARCWVGAVGAVVVCGVAGGLGGPAAAGEVVVATRVVDADGHDAGPVAAVEVPDGLHGVVASVASPLDSVAERERLLGAGAVVVEMEAAAWVRACHLAGVPVAVVRAVLDTPEQPLGASATLVRPGGTGPSAAGLVRTLARPGAWRDLARIGRRAGAAERRAAEAAVCAATQLGRR